MIKRLPALFRRIRDYDKDINRRAAVEQELLEVAAGKRQPPSPERCKELALRLGVPDEFKPKPEGGGVE